MTLTQQIITVAMAVLATMLTRFLPFLLFPSQNKNAQICHSTRRAVAPGNLGYVSYLQLSRTTITSNKDVSYRAYCRISYRWLTCLET